MYSSPKARELSKSEKESLCGKFVALELCLPFFESYRSLKILQKIADCGNRIFFSTMHKLWLRQGR